MSLPSEKTYTDDEIWRIGTQGDDREWCEATGHCGGCGNATCHPDRLCNLTNCSWWGPVCDTCPDRAAQGMHEHLRGGA